MQAARLYGARDIRIDDVPEPGTPGPEQVKIAVTAVGVCGSDLHTYEDGRIGDTQVESPLILGHEFAGVILEVGPDARDGYDAPLHVGQRVAVDPASPCWRCEMCESGHPNLCRRLHFCGLWPDDGSLQEQMLVEARSCFPLPDAISDEVGALLEPLGIGIHAVDLARLRVTTSVSVLGCGPIGLTLIKLAKLSGADPIYAFDCYPWRVAKAKAWGATNAWTLDEGDPVERINQVTGGRGVDVSFEAAWADHSIAQAAEIARLGGRLVLVGIPSEDDLYIKHSTARRKGLTIMMSRRMKHTYPRAIQLVMSEALAVDLEDMISHRLPLSETARAFQMNTAYEEGVHKIVIQVSHSQ